MVSAIVLLTQQSQISLQYHHGRNLRVLGKAAVFLRQINCAGHLLVTNIAQNRIQSVTGFVWLCRSHMVTAIKLISFHLQFHSVISLILSVHAQPNQVRFFTAIKYFQFVVVIRTSSTQKVSPESIEEPSSLILKLLMKLKFL